MKNELSNHKRRLERRSVFKLLLLFLILVSNNLISQSNKELPYSLSRLDSSSDSLIFYYEEGLELDTIIHYADLVVEIDASMQDIKEVPVFFNMFKNLRKIDMSINDLSEAAFSDSKFSHLKELNLSHNRILLENISLPKNISNVNLTDNLLKGELNFEKHYHLETLKVGHNDSLKRILLNTSGLKVLDISFTNVSDLENILFANSSSLESLILEGSTIKTLSISKFMADSKLKHLNLAKTESLVKKVEYLNILNLDSLEVLNLSFNLLDHEKLSGDFPKLEFLVLRHTNLSYIPRCLYKNLTLKTVYVNGNENMILPVYLLKFDKIQIYVDPSTKEYADLVLKPQMAEKFLVPNNTRTHSNF